MYELKTMAMEIINKLRSKKPDIGLLYNLITPADASFRDENGITTLMYAFKYYGINCKCNSSIFHKLINIGSKFDQVDKDGKTTLMYAI